MMRSWLFIYLVVLGMVMVGQASKTSKVLQDIESVHASTDSQLPEVARYILWERVVYEILAKDAAPSRMILERVTDPSSTPLKGAAPVLKAVETAPFLQRRAALLGLPPATSVNSALDQTLSSQIQQLSSTISALSTASVSISQSAITAISQAQDSVTSAILSASQQADQQSSQLIQQSSQLDQQASQLTLASQQASSSVAEATSSLSVQFSSSLASVQASATSAMNVVLAQASSSVASALSAASSLTSKAQAETTSVAVGDADASTLADQIQNNAVSLRNLAIILAASVSGAIVLTIIIACLVFRCLLKRQQARILAETRDFGNDSKGLISQDIDQDSSSNTRKRGWISGKVARDDMNSPRLFTPPSAKKDDRFNFGFSKNNESGKQQRASKTRDVYGVSPDSFRLELPNSDKDIEAARLRLLSEENQRRNKLGLYDPLTSNPPNEPPLSRPPATALASRQQVANSSAKMPQKPAVADSAQRYRPSSSGVFETRPSGEIIGASKLRTGNEIVSNRPNPTLQRPASQRYTLRTPQRISSRDGADLGTAVAYGVAPLPKITNIGDLSNKPSLQDMGRRGGGDQMNDSPKSPRKKGPNLAAFPPPRNAPPEPTYRPKGTGLTINIPQNPNQLVRQSNRKDA
ncbi:hypothetical protein BX600DRAFT_451375 [Xylariales sp. PMI_506]|nr:hypothetical protein BX600DRAFT_451375 [Xylariales sp. PMI_506]